MSTDVSFIKALQNFFSDGDGKKLTIPEMKELTYQDKVELHAYLRDIDIVCTPPMDSGAAA